MNRGRCSVLLAALMGACLPQNAARTDELGTAVQSLRAHGVTVSVPPNLREDRDAGENVTPYSRRYSWSGARVWVQIETCPGVGDAPACSIGAKGFAERPAPRIEGAALRRFESLEANQPRGVVWMTPDGRAERTVVLVIGRSLADSALVRRVADSVEPSPD